MLKAWSGTRSEKAWLWREICLLLLWYPGVPRALLIAGPVKCAILFFSCAGPALRGLIQASRERVHR
jgi:hypothetical protein